MSAFVNNITDTLGVRDIEREGEDLNYQRTITTTDPRVFGLGVRYHFLGNL